MSKATQFLQAMNEADSKIDKAVAAQHAEEKPHREKIAQIRKEVNQVVDQQHAIYTKYNKNDTHDVHPSDFEKADADHYHELDKKRHALSDQSKAEQDAIRAIASKHDAKFKRSVRSTPAKTMKALYGPKKR